jgi:putative spermidine/putrescine transport system permease protein
MRSSYRPDRPSLLVRAGAFAGLAFMHIPVLIIILYAFTTEDRTYQFPPPGLTLQWFSRAFERSDIWQSLTLSLGVAACATIIALILGTLAAFALARAKFPAKDSLTVLFALPIALPGIVTGIALNSAFSTVLEPLGVGLGLFTVIVGHATFCIVVVFNNVVARLRRTSGSYEEAAMDLGADTFRAFADVTFPLVRSALLAGGLLAFALSFDEIVVTTFTAGPGIETLPIWIFNNMTRPQQAPVVNVVAAVLVLFSVLPIYAAQRLSADTASGSRV